MAVEFERYVADYIGPVQVLVETTDRAYWSPGFRYDNLGLRLSRSRP